jgi:hypothetical protein
MRLNCTYTSSYTDVLRQMYGMFCVTFLSLFV